MLRRVPLVLLVGVAVSFAEDILNAFQFANELTTSAIKARIAINGLFMTAYVLVAFALFELAHRVGGRARRALQIAGSLLAAITAWYALRPLIEIFVNRAHVMDVVDYGFIVVGLFHIGIAIAVIVAARGFPRATLAAVLLFVGAFTRASIPGVTEPLFRWLYENPSWGKVYWLANGVCWSVGMIWLAAIIAKDAFEAKPEPAVAARGFRVAAAALRFRIVAAVVIAVVSVGVVRSVEVAKVVTIGGPLVVLAAMVVVASGFLRVARASLDGMSALRLVVGAALTLWWCAVQMSQLRFIYRSFGDSFSSSYDRDFATMFSIAGPLVATAGLALVGTAISTFASKRANDQLRESASVRTLLFVVLSASHIGIQSQVWKAETRDGFLMLVFVAAASGIAAIVSFAGLAKQASDAIETGPTIPAARVVE